MLEGKNYTQKSDIWSVGVILYMLLTGKPPFYGKTQDITVKKILEANISFNGI